MKRVIGSFADIFHQHYHSNIRLVGVGLEGNRQPGVDSYGRFGGASLTSDAVDAAETVPAVPRRSSPTDHSVWTTFRFAGLMGSLLSTVGVNTYVSSPSGVRSTALVKRPVIANGGDKISYL
jgi:hypothetical protein